MDTIAKPQTALSDAELTLVGKIQCPGCTCGCEPARQCESFEPIQRYRHFLCLRHSAGTLISHGIGWIYLGLPKGFNRVGAFRVKGDDTTRNNLRLWIAPARPDWDHLNAPVWAMERDGILYVRTHCPRININYVDVIQGGTMACIPPTCNVIDVAAFYDDID